MKLFVELCATAIAVIVGLALLALIAELARNGFIEHHGERWSTSLTLGTILLLVVTLIALAPGVWIK